MLVREDEPALLPSLPGRLPFRVLHVTTLTDGKVLKPLITTLPAAQRYTYVYDGNSQTLDHTLTTPAVTHFDYDVVHINAEFADQASDHDPQIVRIDVSRCRGH